jgi:glycine/D-amino acid oxidase-like deaminating enzyme
MHMESNQESTVANFGRNAADAGKAFIGSAIETPINGLLEIVHADRKIKLVNAPAQDDTGAKIGHFAGIALDVVAAATLFSKVKLGQFKPGVVASSTFAGALYQGLRPTGGDALTHVENALTGAAAFFAISGSSKLMRSQFELTNLAAKIEHMDIVSKVASKLAVSSTVGILSGAVGGVMDSFTHTTPLKDSVKNYALLGGFFGPIGEGINMVRGISWNTQINPFTAKDNSGTVIDFRKNGIGSDPSPEAAKTLAIQNEQKSSFFKDADNEKRFPTLEGTVKTKVAVIGGGVGGLQVARELSNRGIDTVLVEGARVGGSTSGRMGAMITRSSDGSAQEHLEMYEGERTGKIIEDLAAAQKRVTNLAKSYPDVDYVPGNSNQVSYKTADEDDYLKQEYDLLKKHDPNVTYLNGKDAHYLSPDEKGPVVEQALLLHDEGSVNPRKFTLALASDGKFPVYEDSQVIGLTLNGNRAPVEVHTKEGTVIADHAVFATNGPAPMFEHLYPLLEREQAFATSASADTSRMRNDNYFDTDGVNSPHQIPGEEEYNFFRAIGKPAKNGELLFGGGSLWPDKGTLGYNSTVLQEQLGELFPGAKINSAWSGLLYNTHDGLPLVEQQPQFPQVHNVTGLGGIGLVNGSIGAKSMGDLLSGRKADGFYSSQRLQPADATTPVKDWSVNTTKPSVRMLYAPQPLCAAGQNSQSDQCRAQ